jgi:dihydrolipoamide dehydrogenase
VLVATGRVPNTEPLQLAAGNVAVDETGRILVSAQYQSTTNPKVFAIGDAVAGPQLAHKASREGLFVADVLAGDALALADWVAMPSVVYTTPEAASVGLTLVQAGEQGLAVKHSQVPLAALGRAHTMQQAHGGWVQLVVCAHSNKLLGAQVLAPHAGELIAELTLAIEAGLQAEDVALTVHAHPTLSEAWVEAAEALHQQAIHWYQPLAR